MQSSLSLLCQSLVLQTELCPGNHVLWATLIGYLVCFSLRKLFSGFTSLLLLVWMRFAKISNNTKHMCLSNQHQVWNNDLRSNNICTPAARLSHLHL